MPLESNIQIRQSLLAWYRKNSRDLPWRNTKDPYLIWISEVMLQQTRVDTVIPYFMKWAKAFPDVNILSAGSEEQVLRIWEGLGYYSRARNIKKAADIIVREYSGNLPEEIRKLKQLPGIGDYISAAIASIAFGQAAPALEANGVRVISRLANFQELIENSHAKKTLRKTLQKIIGKGDAGELNQAIMDLGSLVCLPRNPKCSVCPLKEYCLAYHANNQEFLPVKKKRKPTPHVQVVAAVIHNEANNQVLITKRKPDALLGGLWEYPGGKVEDGESYQEALARELREELGIKVSVGSCIGEYDHAYTHFSVTVHVYQAEILSGEITALDVADFQWVALDLLAEYPMGKVDRRISLSLHA